MLQHFSSDRSGLRGPNAVNLPWLLCCAHKHRVLVETVVRINYCATAAQLREENLARMRCCDAAETLVVTREPV